MYICDFCIWKVDLGGFGMSFVDEWDSQKGGENGNIGRVRNR